MSWAEPPRPCSSTSAPVASGVGAPQPGMFRGERVVATTVQVTELAREVEARSGRLQRMHVYLDWDTLCK
jgi:hypothetical protein